MIKNKIVFVHLLNDYSGSPAVLSSIIKGFVEAGHPVDVWCAHGKGHLSGLKGVNYHHFQYQYHQNKLITFYRLMICQLMLMVRLMNYYQKEPVKYYINTLLPFGALLAAKFSGKEAYHHVHESYIRPRLFLNFLKFISVSCATNIFFVSEYVRNALGMHTDKGSIISNSLSSEFTAKADSFQKDYRPGRPVLMLASLKKYKGIDVYVNLAYQLPEIPFELVINANQKEIDDYFGRDLPANLKIFPAQKNVHPFYERAGLVVNLTLPDLCIESFGLTLLEGMAYGTPVIGPPEGGPAEVVDDGINGYLVDPYEEDTLKKTISALMNGSEKWSEMGEEARAYAEKYSYESTFKKIYKYVIKVSR